jgi:Na+-driven multidrug efflux pump
VILSVAVILLAEPLSYVFTYSEGMSELREEFSKVIRIYGFVILFLAVTDVCSSILQTLQYATLAMGTMFFRECLFILFYWISTFISMDAIYWSLLIAEGLGALIMMIFANYSIRKRAPEYTASPS